MHTRINTLALTGLACITLCLSSWNLYRLFTEYGQMPPGWAVVVVAGLDLSAVGFGAQALEVARRKDSPWPWNLLLVATVFTSAWAQYERAALDGDPQAVRVVSAVFPVVTVLLFEGQLRMRFREAMRDAGLMQEARPVIDGMTWFIFPRLSWAGFKSGVLNHEQTTRKVLMDAERTLSGQIPEPRVVERLDVRREDGATVVVRTTEPGKPKVSDAVRTAIAEGADTVPAVVQRVSIIRPDVRTDSIERQARRAMNGSH